jgi:cob(I)alamin adenosyltransferase
MNRGTSINDTQVAGNGNMEGTSITAVRKVCVAPVRFQRGLIQVYTGDGKGKTSAALGQAMRAAGHGFKVYMAQFMKGWMEEGELRTVAEHPTITLKQFGRRSFVDRQNPDPVDVSLAQSALQEVTRVVLGEEYDLVILDEVNVALAWKLIELKDLLSLLDRKPQGVEILLTGRHAHPDVIARADLVTEMRAVKHPYERGITSRRGMDY